MRHIQKWSRDTPDLGITSDRNRTIWDARDLVQAGCIVSRVPYPLYYLQSPGLGAFCVQWGGLSGSVQRLTLL